MSFSDPTILEQVRKLIAQDLKSARSDEDLVCRLARQGYGLRVTEHGRVLTTLPHGVEVGPLG